MSFILDDNDVNDSNVEQSVLAITRLKTIASRTQTIGIIQLIVFVLMALFILAAFSFKSIILVGLSEILREARIVAMNVEELITILKWVFGVSLVGIIAYIMATINLLSYASKLSAYIKTGRIAYFEEVLVSRKRYFIIMTVITFVSLVISIYFAYFAMQLSR